MEPNTSVSTNQEFDIGFSRPRHWITPEELNPSYWADPANLEKRGQEFIDKPIEGISLIDKIDTKGVARRDFLTLMGASMAMAGFACARRPVHKIIPYVVQPQEIIPGNANYYASTDAETGMGFLVKTREGRPIKLEGNPEHPINQGTLTARMQAKILDLYDPDRLTVPKSHERMTGIVKEVTWTDADRDIAATLKANLGNGKIRLLTGAVVSPSTRRLIEEFMAPFGGAAANHIEFEVTSLEEVADGQAESYGSAVIPKYDFSKAEAVVSIGADFLANWVSPLEHSRQWAKLRKLNSDQASSAKMSKTITFESTVTLTGSNSDERYSIRPGDELRVALAIANELIVTKGRSKFALDSAVKSALQSYSAKTIAEEIGIEPSAITQAAEILWENRGKSLVVAGGVHSKSESALALQIAANLLNSALENEGKTVDGTAETGTYGASFAKMAKLIADMSAGHVATLIVHGVNPVFNLPTELGFVDAIAKVPLVISITDREDETASLGDWILPDHHALENWGDASVRKGVYSLQQPTLAPIHSSRSLQDSLLTWTKVGKLPVSGLAAKVAAAAEENTWHDYLMANWKESMHKLSGSSMAFNQFWEKTLQLGVMTVKTGSPSARSFKSAAVSKFPKFAPQGQDIRLVLYPSAAMGDGRQANNPWLQEMPDPISRITWDNYANLSPSTAKRLGVVNNDVIEIAGDGFKVELPVSIQPGLHPTVVSIPIGYGRTAAGKVGNGVGKNVYPFLKVANGRLEFAGRKVALSKTGKMYHLGATQLHHVSENRPVINDITLAQFKSNPSSANHTDPHLRLETVPSMWERHEYKGYRWGMAIDLNACTGCGACVVGCQAENNIPVVGRANVRMGRELHWIRIDRYYSGSEENPDLVFQPMLCQHCENAPCETVCPVIATMHDDEGTNNQIYNRCVGTRYCQNNCPYKVRRFNFFDHWKSYEGTMNMAWNPDVTVRTRGIMEKCSFCIQRVNRTRFEQKNKGEKILDGMVKTACQQTCPTDAISFGDINDPSTRVSQLHQQKHGFHSLEVLNTRPSITYLSKVRNKMAVAGEHSPGAEGAEGGHE